MEFCFYCKNEKATVRACTSCKKVGYCSKNCQKKDWPTHREVCQNPDLLVWPREMTEKFLDLMAESIDIYKILYLLDRTVAQSFRSHSHHECGHKHSLIEWREDMSTLEKTLYEVSSRSRLLEILPSFAEETGQIFRNIQAKGRKDGLELDPETEKRLMKEVIEEAMTRRLVKEVNSYNRHEEETTSKQPLLLAYPTGFQEQTNNELELLNAETIREFMENDFAIQDKFIGDFGVTDFLYREAEYLDIDGRFEEIIQQKLKKIRSDKILWVRKDIIDKSLEGEHTSPLHLALSYCPKLKVLNDVLFSLPFELNKKTSLGLQIADSMCLDCFTAGTYHIEHLDSAFGKNDTGRKVTCLYFITDTRGQYIKVKNTNIEIVHDRLVILKSRKVPYEIPTSSNKFFIATSLIPGPADSFQ